MASAARGRRTICNAACPIAARTRWKFGIASTRHFGDNFAFRCLSLRRRYKILCK